MSAHVVRLGSGISMMSPDPKLGGGYYLFVANGDLEIHGKCLPRWSMVFVEPGEDAVEIRVGQKGLEALPAWGVARYPLRIKRRLVSPMRDCKALRMIPHS
jgi:hypothetical protein